MVVGDMSWVTSPTTFLLAGLIGVAVWVYRAIARGTLVPASTMERREADWAARLAEVQRVADERLAQSREDTEIWRTAHGESESVRIAQQHMIEQLVVLGETSVAILKALPKANQ